MQDDDEEESDDPVEAPKLTFKPRTAPKGKRTSSEAAGETVNKKSKKSPKKTQTQTKLTTVKDKVSVMTKLIKITPLPMIWSRFGELTVCVRCCT